MIYSWQDTQWNKLQRQIGAGKLAHGLLLTGLDGLGKLEFATELAASVLCQQAAESGQACGECAACHLLAAGTHPDLFVVQAEEKGKAIRVDEIRQLSASLSLTSQYGGYKVTILVDAHDMNINAANSLLKTLEEPASDALLILISSNPQKLPITVRSRCQVIGFNVPPPEEARAWLQAEGIKEPDGLLGLAHGAPLRALELQQDGQIEQHGVLVDSLLSVTRQGSTVEQAEQLHKLPQQGLLGWLYDWVQDLIRLHQCGDVARLVHENYRAELKQLASRSSLQALYDYLDQIIKNRQLQSIPLNTQLLWEDLLLSWKQLIK